MSKPLVLIVEDGSYVRNLMTTTLSARSEDGEDLRLTPIEFKLLSLLSRNTGKELTHTFITQNIRGHSWYNDIAPSGSSWPPCVRNRNRETVPPSTSRPTSAWATVC